jgi:dTDP-4-dehydrorhamnose reductase
VLRVLLLGARSQLGHDIARTWSDVALTPLGHDACDVAAPDAVRAAIDASQPDLVVNLAASHRVDDVERDPEEALRVNAYGAWCVARAAADAGAAVMWVSTDYVFSGDAGRPYVERDAVGPVNAYGASKAAGERLLALANPRHYIVRSSGLFGVAGASGKGGNFVETMLRLAREGKPLRVVHDQVLGPTSTRELAETMATVARSQSYGLYHITNEGAMSWHDFAALTFRLCHVAADLEPTTSEAFGAPARRPAFSVLANTRLPSIGAAPLPPIEAALRDYLVEKGHIAPATR